MPIAMIYGVGGGGKQPQMFTPTISLNVTNNILTISDGNGDFSSYEIYIDDVLNTSLQVVNKTADLSSVISQATTDTSIQVKAVGNGFKSSDMSNEIIWKYGIGTLGLAYTLSEDGTYYICSGIGTATDTNIEIGSIHEGLPVRRIADNAFLDNLTISSK